MGSVPIARVVRSGVVESVHLGDVAVCDATGRLLASVGDPDAGRVRALVHEADPGRGLAGRDRRAGARRRDRRDVLLAQRRAGARARGASAVAARRARRLGAAQPGGAADGSGVRDPRAGRRAGVPGLQREPRGDARGRARAPAGRWTRTGLARTRITVACCPWCERSPAPSPSWGSTAAGSRCTGCRCRRIATMYARLAVARDHRPRTGDRSRDRRDARRALPRRRPGRATTPRSWRRPRTSW